MKRFFFFALSPIVLVLLLSSQFSIGQDACAKAQQCRQEAAQYQALANGPQGAYYAQAAQACLNAAAAYDAQCAQSGASGYSSSSSVINSVNQEDNSRIAAIQTGIGLFGQILNKIQQNQQQESQLEESQQQEQQDEQLQQQLQEQLQQLQQQQNQQQNGQAPQDQANLQQPNLNQQQDPETANQDSILDLNFGVSPQNTSQAEESTEEQDSILAGDNDSNNTLSKGGAANQPQTEVYTDSQGGMHSVTTTTFPPGSGNSSVIEFNQVPQNTPTQVPQDGRQVGETTYQSTQPGVMTKQTITTYPSGQKVIDYTPQPTDQNAAEDAILNDD